MNEMRKQINLLTALFPAIFLYLSGLPSIAGQSKRIEVYSISQNFWDVSPGETLAGIVNYLLPDNPHLHEKLQVQIVRLNPHAFSQGNPDSLGANIRLWLPNNVPAIPRIKDKNIYHIKSFSWGQVYKSKRD